MKLVSPQMRRADELETQHARLQLIESRNATISVMKTGIPSFAVVIDGYNHAETHSRLTNRRNRQKLE